MQTALLFNAELFSSDTPCTCQRKKWLSAESKWDNLRVKVCELTLKILRVSWELSVSDLIKDNTMTQELQLWKQKIQELIIIWRLLNCGYADVLGSHLIFWTFSVQFCSLLQQKNNHHVRSIVVSQLYHVWHNQKWNAVFVASCKDGLMQAEIRKAFAFHQKEIFKKKRKGDISDGL